MSEQPLRDKNILVTGSARRIGRSLARACASAGANLAVHYDTSAQDAAEVQAEIRDMGRKCVLVQADLATMTDAAGLVEQAAALGPLYGLVNNASIFETHGMLSTSLQAWERTLRINLTTPFLLSQAFAAQVPSDSEGRIVNMLDWRALRPGADHFAYTISKAALAALTESMAAALAPRITVNGLALGAILPPSGSQAAPDLLKSVPAGRWGELPEVEQAMLFLLSGPAYVTGEILHVDGGRHLT